jgi:dienelactone hydrolase
MTKDQIAQFVPFGLRCKRRALVLVGAPHGFFVDYRQSYRPEAAPDASATMQAWFKKYKVLD